MKSGEKILSSRNEWRENTRWENKKCGEKTQPRNSGVQMTRKQDGWLFSCGNGSSFRRLSREMDRKCNWWNIQIQLAVIIYGSSRSSNSKKNFTLKRNERLIWFPRCWKSNSRLVAHIGSTAQLLVLNDCRILMISRVRSNMLRKNEKFSISCREMWLTLQNSFITYSGECRLHLDNKIFSSVFKSIAASPPLPQ